MWYIHPYKGTLAAAKRNEGLTHVTMWVNTVYEYYANWMPYAKDHRLYDSIYMKHLEFVNQQRKRSGCQG